MEVKGCGEELKEISSSGCEMGQRSRTQEQVRSGKAKGSRFCSNEIKTAVVMHLSLSPRTSCLGFHSAP